MKLMRLLTYPALIFAAMLIAGIYGALHDQISFTVSSEYFTKFKYHQFGLAESSLPDRAKAAFIGFAATWWMGFPIGVIVGAFGFLHKTAGLMLTRSLKAFGVVTIVALGVGIGGLIYGWFFASHDPAEYSGWFLPKDLIFSANYLSVGHMHNFSYLGGVIGLVAGVIFQFVQRSKPSNLDQSIPEDRNST